MPFTLRSTFQNGNNMSSIHFTFLVIDNDPTLLASLEACLTPSGSTLLVAEETHAAFALFEQKKPDAVIIDFTVPGINGFEFISQLSSQSPSTPIIVISGTKTIEEAIGAMQCGAWSFLQKPLQKAEDLQKAIHSALHRARSMRESKKYKEALEQKIARRTRELQEATKRTEAILLATVHSLSTIINLKDAYTGTHQQRVALIAPAIALELGMGQSAAEAMRLASLLHDVGKMGLPSEFLTKPTALDANEIQFIHEHPRLSYEIIQNIPFELPIPLMVYQHHERLDGSGYPQGLRGDEIMLEAQILGVADTMEAICSHRPWRPAHSFTYAQKYLRKARGRLLRTDVIDACLALFERRDPRLSSIFTTIKGLNL